MRKTVFSLAFLLALCGSALGADEFPLTATVITAKSPAQKALAEVIAKAPPAEIPAWWENHPALHTDWIQGKGYVASLAFFGGATSVVTPPGMHDISVQLRVMIPGANICHGLEPVQIVEGRDEAGRPVIKDPTLPEIEDPQPLTDPTKGPFRIFPGGSLEPASTEPSHEATFNFSYRANADARIIKVLRGYAYVLCATGEDVLDFKQFDPDGQIYEFPQVKMRVKIMPEQRPGAGYPVEFARLDAYVPPWGPDLKVVTGSLSPAFLNPIVYIRLVTPDGKETPYAYFAREANMPTRVRSPVAAPNTLRFRVVSEVALVRIAYEFKDVAVPTSAEMTTALEFPRRAVPASTKRAETQKLR